MAAKSQSSNMEREHKNALIWQMPAETIDGHVSRQGPEIRGRVALSPLPHQQIAVPAASTPQASRRLNNTKITQRPTPPKSAPPPRRGPTMIRQRVVLDFNRDNAAKSAWRRLNRPDKILRLDQAPMKLEGNKKKLFTMFEEFGIRLGTFIRPPQSIDDVNIQMWGTPEQVALTVKEIEEWVSEMRHTSNTKWSKDVNVKGESYQRLLGKVRLDAKKARFQQDPDPNKVFPVTMHFLWPFDEVHPHELLGSNLEAFDTIRRYFAVFITLDSQRGGFHISGSKAGDIQQVDQRIKGTMTEYVTRSASSPTIIVVDYPVKPGVRREVRMMDGGLLSTGAEGKTPVSIDVPVPAEEAEACEKDTRALGALNFRRIQKAMAFALHRLPSYRGHNSMCVHFGTFALSTFRWRQGQETYPGNVFAKNVAASSTKGELIRDLWFEDDARTIFSHIHANADLFAISGRSRIPLEDMRSISTARFNLNFPGTGNVVYEVETSRSGLPLNTGGAAEIGTGRWVKKENSVIQELFVARLEGRTSWKLDIRSTPRIEESKITPRMLRFANSVKVIQSALSGQKVFKWEGAVPISSYEQKTAIRYKLSEESMYVFEIARYDSYGGPKPNEPVSTQWGASLWCDEWATQLAMNHDLKIGEKSKLDQSINTWFPPKGFNLTEPDTGLRDFVGYAGSIAEYLDTLKRRGGEETQR